MDRRGEPARTRRRHSEEFKAQVVAECRRPGASVSAAALRHGLNANLVRQWLNGRKGVGPRTPMPTPSRDAPASLVNDKFLPVMVDAPPPPPMDIRIDVSRGATTMVVRWPQSEARACAEWRSEE